MDDGLVTAKLAAGLIAWRQDIGRYPTTAHYPQVMFWLLACCNEGVPKSTNS